MSTKYILHGGFTSEENEHNKNFFTECFSDASQKSNILIVLFAAEDDGDIGYYRNLCVRLRNYASTQSSFEKANRDDFISQVEKADIIFLQGGDTNRIITALKEYVNLSELFENKTIIGSSAGAYALAALGTAHGEVHAREGLAILPLRVVCHYKSDRLPPSDTSLEEIKTTQEELPLILLKDCEFRVFYGDEEKIPIFPDSNRIKTQK